MNVHKVSLCAAVAGIVIASSLVSNSLRGADRARKMEGAAAQFEQVELFEGMKAGTIAVRFIPADSRSANVLIKNNTDRPLTIKLPEAFAGVPVLAQMEMGGGMGGMGGGMGGMGGGMGGMGGGQGMGGGFGGMGGMGGMGGGMGGFGGGGFGGMGGGFFNVAAEKEGKVKVTTVCLEHGKTEPNPRMKYTIQPIEALTKDPRVVEVCKMVGRGDVPQNAGQAAAWFLANGLSWQELRAKDRIRSVAGTAKYFSEQELALAMQIASIAATRAQGTTGEQPYVPGGVQSQSAGR
jgi:hypothetical protein